MTSPFNFNNLLTIKIDSVNEFVNTTVNKNLLTGCLLLTVFAKMTLINHPNKYYVFVIKIIRFPLSSLLKLNNCNLFIK